MGKPRPKGVHFHTSHSKTASLEGCPHHHLASSRPPEAAPSLRQNAHLPRGGRPGLQLFSVSPWLCLGLPTPFALLSGTDQALRRPGEVGGGLPAACGPPATELSTNVDGESWCCFQRESSSSLPIGDNVCFFIKLKKFFPLPCLLTTFTTARY